tara:strand:+ start:1017 stop:1358 length:342 start_codon:yes stop_codon:yes gene_type:complete
MNYQETLYGKQFLLGRDVYVDGQHKILNVPLIDVMDELGFIPESDYSQIYTLSVVWYEDKFGDIVVHQIYDHDSGKILWEDKPESDWTDNDEELLNALLMYGNLQQTIGEYYV